MKRVIITGGTGGLGIAMDRKFNEQGWSVKSLSSLDLDLTNLDELNAFFSSECCDLLVCAAGIIRDAPMHKMEEVEWDDVMEVNYQMAANCAKAALQGMVERKSGHILFISSQAALRPAIGQAAYSSAKSALHGLTEYLAEKYGKYGIRINCIIPGFLETPMTSVVSEKRKMAIRETHSLGRFNTVDKVAEFTHFLQETMSYTSGQMFRLDSRI